MRGFGRVLLLLVIICLILSVGCAKKKITPIGGEIQPPPPMQVQQPVAPGAGMTPQPIEMPQVQSRFASTSGRETR